MLESIPFIELVGTIIVASVADVTLAAALNMSERRDGRCSTVKQPRDDLCDVGSGSLIDDVVLQNKHLWVELNCAKHRLEKI